MFQSTPLGVREHLWSLFRGQNGPRAYRALESAAVRMSPPELICGARHRVAEPPLAKARAGRATPEGALCGPGRAGVRAEP